MTPQSPNNAGRAEDTLGSAPPSALPQEPDSRSNAPRVPARLCCGDEAAQWRPLNGKQRSARLVVGIGLVLWAIAMPWTPVASVLVALLAWVGASHVLAAAMAYPGCPELGAVPSLVLRRDVKVACGPWQWLDECLGLTAKEAAATPADANGHSSRRS